jgi:hypothetical protein
VFKETLLLKTSEILKGMRKWCKDGTLPDGSKGVMRAVKIETESGEVLTARDRDERRLISNIDYQQQQIEYCSRFVTVKPEDEFLALVCPESMCAGWPESRRTEFKEDSLRLRANMIRDIPKFEERIEVSQKFIRGFTSQLWAHRWRRAVKDTQTIHDESVPFLAELRVLSTDVFSWLIKGGYVALYLSEKTTRDGSRKWNDTEIAFPVARSVSETVWPDTSRYWPGFRRGVEFLGMHCK